MIAKLVPKRLLYGEYYSRWFDFDFIPTKRNHMSQVLSLTNRL